MILLVLKFISAHFVTRLLLQPDLHAEVKAQENRAAAVLLLLRHSGLFLLVTAVLILPAYRSAQMGWPLLIALLVATGILHFVVDLLGMQFSALWKGFILGQVAHVLSITVAVSCFGNIPGLSAFLLDA